MHAIDNDVVLIYLDRRQQIDAARVFLDLGRLDPMAWVEVLAIDQIRQRAGDGFNIHAMLPR